MPENVGVGFDIPANVDQMEVGVTSSKRVSTINRSSVQREDGTVQEGSGMPGSHEYRPAQTADVIRRELSEPKPGETLVVTAVTVHE